MNADPLKVRTRGPYYFGRSKPRARKSPHGCGRAHKLAYGAADGESDQEGGKGKTPGKYMEFWKHYGKPMKLGLIEDSGNRQRIAKLIR